jgi:CHAT domain-containing protein
LRKVDLAKYRVVMFATHGLVPGDLKGLTQPALALSAPEVAADGGSGLLTAERILSLKLDADWVVLSACNTAAAAGAGAEAVSGLGRAFFYAGTRALLVSNWPVETTSARALTTDLFRRQAAEPSLSRAEALRRAMVALFEGPGFVDGGKTLFSYGHPIFWAPFSLVGDAGAPSPK